MKQRLLTLVAMMVLPTTAALFVGIQTGNQEPQRLKAGCVHARELLVEDPIGNTVAKLKGEAQTTILEFLDKHQKPRLVLRCDVSGEVSVTLKGGEGKITTGLQLAKNGDAALWVRNNRGTICITSGDDDPPLLRVRGTSGRNLLSLGVQVESGTGGESGALQLGTAKENSVVLAAKDGGETALVMTDDQGAPRVAVGIDKSNGSGVQARGASGKAVVGVYARKNAEVGVHIRNESGERAVLGTNAHNETKLFVKNKEGKVTFAASK